MSRPNNSSAGQPIVAVQDVTVRLGDVLAVDGGSITADPGQLVGIIGPNGAGKTTLLRTITAAITPDEGTVTVTGMNVHERSSRAVSRAVAVVPQDTSLAFDFDVRQLVAMGRTPYLDRMGRSDGSDRDAVDRAMERTEVAQFADRMVSELSGGERQRVLLARAIAQETPVLLLDEPTASLDINHQLRTLELVRELVDGGTTVLAAIHDLDLAARFCDELILLDEGNVVDDGSPETVLTAENLERVFGTPAAVRTNPVTDSVQVIPLERQ